MSQNNEQAIHHLEQALLLLKNSTEELKDTKEVKADSKYCKCSDAGHSGFDPDGNYLTNGKFWVHEKGIFHKNSTIFEGVFNRTMQNKVLKHYKENGIKYLVLNHEYLDTPLQERSRKANAYHKEVQKCTLDSLHSNASQNQEARGVSIWTSIGQTESDKSANDQWLRIYKNLVPKYGIKMLKQDWVDGDYDYEANFWMCKQTAMPSKLNEFLFFDNYDDALLTMREDVQDDYALQIYHNTVWEMDNLKI